MIRSFHNSIANEIWNGPSRIVSVIGAIWLCLMRSQSAHALLIGSLLSCSITAVATADDHADIVAPAPDGRYIINIWDIRLIVPGPLLSHIAVHASSTVRCGRVAVVTAETLFSDQTIAQCTAKAMEQSGWFALDIYHNNTTGPSSLDAHARDPIFGGAVEVTTHILIMKPGATLQPDGRDRRMPEVLDADGFVVVPGPPLHPNSRLKGTKFDPKWTRYLRPASKRVIPSTLPLQIGCSWTGAGVRECRTFLRSPDQRVSVSVGWWEDKVPKSANWAKFEPWLRDYARLVFMDNLWEKLQ